MDDAGERPSTFLVASTPITAHTLNASRFVAGLARAGHRVLWYANERHREQVEGCGATLVAQRTGPGPNGGPSRGRVTSVRWVDYSAALAEADLFVTNGGYSGVTMAIAAGVPVVQAGSTEEKADVGARVAWAGVGARLRSARRPRWWLRRVVRDVMGSARRAEASRRLADEFARHDAARIGTTLLVSLAEAGRGIRA